MREPLPTIVKECFAANENDPLRKIVQVITQACQPEQIFVINYGFLVKDFSIAADLLVLIPDSTNFSYVMLQTAIEEMCATIGSVTVTLEKPGKVYKALKGGHIFFTWVCHADNLIYDTGNYNLPEEQKINTNPIVEKARFVFETGFLRAQAFFDGARYYLAFKNDRMVAFMLSQATVQILLAFLTALTGYNHFTHKLPRLFRFTRRITNELFTIFPRGDEEAAELLSLLYNAYSKARYRNTISISEEQVAALYEMVIKLLPLAKSELEDSLQKFERTFQNR